MPKIQLTSDTIGDLDGGLARHIIDHALQAAVSDVEDRGDDGKARKVVVEIEMKKLKNGTVAIVPQVKTSIPAYRGPGTFADVLGKTGRAQLHFQSHNADRPDQAPLPVMDDEEDK